MRWSGFPKSQRSETITLRSCRYLKSFRIIVLFKKIAFFKPAWGGGEGWEVREDFNLEWKGSELIFFNKYSLGGVQINYVSLKPPLPPTPPL